MTQEELLSSARLRLNGPVRCDAPERGWAVMRSAGGFRRLVVTPAQAALLVDGFTAEQTVPEVLARMIGENRCPPLRDFYELVLQAHAAGVLVSVPPAPAASPAVRWRFRLPLPAGRAIGWILFLAGVAGLAVTVRQWQGPPGWREWVAGWMAGCALLSLGQVLAAGGVAGSGGEVRAARLYWRTLFPHFRIDEAEALARGRAVARTVAVLRGAPVVAGAAALAWKAPAFLAPVLVAALYVLMPWGRSAVLQWLEARRRTPWFSVRSGFIFEPVRQDLWLLWSGSWRELWSRFGLAWLVATAAWAGAVALAAVRCAPRLTSTLVADFGGSGRLRPLLAVGLYSLIAAGLIGAGSLIWAAVRHWRLKRTWGRPLRGADARNPDRPDLEGDPAAALKAMPLFADLNDADLAALAAAMEPVQVERKQTVVREDEPGDAFYVVITGELEILKRRTGSKRSATIGWMGPGEGFGEIALLERTPRTATVRARRATRLLKLGRDEFERLVVGRVGPQRLREVLQFARFLGRLTWMAGWPPAELVPFARRCQVQRFDAGAMVLQRGDTNRWFFLVYDGAFEVRDGRRVLRRLGPGDYFGEISLLAEWPATADVVAIEESRCLLLSRADFLEFFSRDFRIGLRIEAVAGQRLGAKVFSRRRGE